MKKNADEYVALAIKRKEDFAPLHKKMREWEDWYYLRHYKNQDSATANNNSPTYRHVDTVGFDYPQQLVAMLAVPNVQRVFHTDRPESEKAQTIQDDAEKYVIGVWELNRRRMRGDLLRQILLDQVVRSMAFAYVYVDRQRYELYKSDEARSYYFPIVIERLNPFACFFDPTPGRWAWTDCFIRAEQLSPRQVADMWGFEAMSAAATGSYQEDDPAYDDDRLDYIDVWEFTTGKGGKPELWNGIIYDGKWVVPPRNVSKWYPTLPFVMIPALDIPNEKLEDRYLSPLAPVIFNSKTLEGIVNRVMTNATFNADPVMLLRMQNPGIVKRGPGQQIPLMDGESISYLQPGMISPQVLQIFQLVQGDLERTSLSRANYGNAPGAWSGYTLNQAIQASSLKNQPIADNAKQGISEIDQLIIDESVLLFGDEPVTAYGSKNGTPFRVKLAHASDMKGLHVQTNLNPRSPTDEQAKAGLAAMYRAPGPGGSPLLPDEHIRREIMGIDDAKAAERGIWKEQIMAIPAIKKYALLMALKANNDWPKPVVDQAVGELEMQLGLASGQMEMQSLQVQQQLKQARDAEAQGQPVQAPAGNAAPTAMGGASPEGGTASALAGASPEPSAGGAPSGGGAAGQPGAGGNDVDAARKIVQGAMQSGKLTPPVGNKALQMLDQGTPAIQVVQWLQQQIGGAAPSPAQEQAGSPSPMAGAPQAQPYNPPSGQMPPGTQAAPPPRPQQQPQQPLPPAPVQQPSLRDSIIAAVNAGDLPRGVGEQALQMLDQGAPEQAVMDFINQSLAQEQMAQPQEQAQPMQETAPEQAQGNVPGDLTLDEARMYLEQYGLDALIPQLEMLTQQLGSAGQALQAVLAQLTLEGEQSG
jgi:hypothetical protein